MSYRPVTRQVNAHVCDLCGEEIPEVTDKREYGSLLGGTVDSEEWAKTPTSLRKRVTLRWPPEHKPRHIAPDGRVEERCRYDFHGACIVALVEANLFDFGDAKA